MTEQNDAAAERSAHVERGAGRRIPGESFLVEVSPGIFKLKAVVEAEREIERLRSALRECAGDLEDELRARYGTPPHPAEARRFARDMEVVEMARRLANGD
jgi:hypothetical protein